MRFIRLLNCVEHEPTFYIYRYMREEKIKAFHYEGMVPHIQILSNTRVLQENISLPPLESQIPWPLRIWIINQFFTANCLHLQRESDNVDDLKRVLLKVKAFLLLLLDLLSGKYER